MNFDQRTQLTKRFLALGVLFLVGCSEGPTTVPVASLTESASPQAELVSTSESSQTAEAVAPAEKSQPAAATENEPKVPPRYTVRKAVSAPETATIPPVLLSAGHAKLCTAKVGDAFPKLSLPKLGGGETDLATLRGKQATVILFWHPDRWMARTALIDMQRDIAAQFPADQISVVGIAVRQPAGAVQGALNQAQAQFPQLLDTEGKALATVGTQALPRLYVLDPAGKIVWFDIEYSEGTRRELWQTLAVLTKK